MDRVLVKGCCPSCSAKIGFYRQVEIIFGAIVDRGNGWQDLKCPRCGITIEGRMKQKQEVKI